MKVQPQTKAALLYLLPAAAILAIWYVLLFKGNTQQSSATGTLGYLLTEDPNSIWFTWLLVLPAGFLALSAGYSMSLARSRRGSKALLAIGISLAVAAWLTVSTEIAVFASLPVLYGLAAAKQVNRSHAENGA
ncbi:hypothetical protein [Piscinibacter gummiphilus]|uniref:Uncharacterized protein n=1 Tax=Piscinibacter gummiphilus TaxID=946333 RepID=A0ABZ0CWL4_9BURK|nr:hypothetical protein [Piscinibacter gummiphilus]WOB06884.1 hypothetical protein RXV79_18400 [Piscinibacter gummiphilus]